jgi:hypothetical protein
VTPDLDVSDYLFIITFGLHIFGKNTNYTDDVLMRGLEWKREKVHHQGSTNILPLAHGRTA